MYYDYKEGKKKIEEIIKTLIKAYNPKIQTHIDPRKKIK